MLKWQIPAALASQTDSSQHTNHKYSQVRVYHYFLNNIEGDETIVEASDYYLRNND
jgi:hypothetical protein